MSPNQRQSLTNSADLSLRYNGLSQTEGLGRFVRNIGRGCSTQNPSSISDSDSTFHLRSSWYSFQRQKLRLAISTAPNGPSFKTPGSIGDLYWWWLEMKRLEIDLNMPYDIPDVFTFFLPFPKSAKPLILFLGFAVEFSKSLGRVTYLRLAVQYSDGTLSDESRIFCSSDGISKGEYLLVYSAYARSGRPRSSGFLNAN